MTIEIVCYWQTLMQYACELGQARLRGDEDEIKIAKENHNAYKKLCLESNKMVL